MKTLSDWKVTANQIRNDMEELQKLRQEAMDDMDQSLRKLFSDNGLPLKSLFWSDDLSIIQVHFMGDTKSHISFPRKLLMDIGMPFAVKRFTNKKGNQELFLELYPLEG